MNKISILMIEDEIDLRCTVAAFFEDLGYQIFAAGNGSEGLELFRKLHPAIIFTDLRIPILDGFGVIEAILQKSPDTPFIVISGNGNLQI